MFVNAQNCQEEIRIVAIGDCSSSLCDLTRQTFMILFFIRICSGEDDEIVY